MVNLAARQIDLGRLGGEVARRLCDLLGLSTDWPGLNDPFVTIALCIVRSAIGKHVASSNVIDSVGM
jgi:hypothetical protein